MLYVSQRSLPAFMQSRVKAELDNLQEGLEELGVLSLLLDNPRILRQLFLAQFQCLSADLMQDLFDVQFSPLGANTIEKEEQQVLFWINFLHEVEVSIT